MYDYCKDEGIEILLEIPYMREIAVSYSHGMPFVTQMSEWKSRFSDLFEKIKEADK